MNNIKKLAIITGHSAGLGKALAQHYLATGWQVLGLSRRLWAPTPGLQQAILDLADSGAVAAWLLATGQTPSVDAALIRLAGCRPRIRLGRQHRAALEAIQQRLDAPGVVKE